MAGGATVLGPFVWRQNQAAGFKFIHLTATNASIKTGGGYLHSFNINTIAATAVVTLADTVLGTIAIITGVAAGVNPVSLLFDLEFTGTLSVTIATAAADVTVTYC